MSRKGLILGVLALIAVAAYFGLRGQARYAKIVTELSHIDTFEVPIESTFHSALLEGAQKGLNLKDLKLHPKFTYLAVRVGEADLLVRPAYTEGRAPQGAVMTMPLMEFLRSTADDPRAQGIAVNPGVAGGTFSVTLEKPQILRVIESLKRRGFKDPNGR